MKTSTESRTDGWNGEQTGQRHARGQKPAEKVKLLWQRSFREQPSFLEELSVEIGLVTEHLYSVFSFESLHSLHLEVPRLSKSSLLQHFSCDDVYCHQLGPG